MEIGALTRDYLNFFRGTGVQTYDDKMKFPPSTLWQYRWWSFRMGYIKLERFLHENQHTQRKFLNFENWNFVSID